MDEGGIKCHHNNGTMARSEPIDNLGKEGSDKEKEEYCQEEPNGPYLEKQMGKNRQEHHEEGTC
jgi:hypothetical protein